MHGVTVPDNPTRNFNSSRKFTKTPAERYDGGEDWWNVINGVGFSGTKLKYKWLYENMSIISSLFQYWH